MAKQPKRVKVSDLKGVRLYNFLLRTLSEENQKSGNKQQLGNVSRRRIVSQVLYPKFKQGKVSLTAIRSDIKRIIRKLPPSEICNPLYLSESYLGAEEYYEIDNHIRTVLPDCLDVAVNAGYLGQTKIFNTSNYTYYSSGVKRIIENIRQELADNSSGVARFYGVVKLKPKKRNDGNPNNYYVEYVLYFGDSPSVDDTPVDYELPKKELKKKLEVEKYQDNKLKSLQKEKKKRKLAKKKASPEFKIKSEIKAYESQLQSLENFKNAGMLTRQQYLNEKREINKKLKEAKQRLSQLKK